LRGDWADGGAVIEEGSLKGNFMGFQREEETEDGVTQITYRPDTKHPWLSFITIECQKGDLPLVTIFPREDEESAKIVQEKVIQLKKLQKESIAHAKGKLLSSLPEEERAAMQTDIHRAEAVAAVSKEMDVVGNNNSSLDFLFKEDSFSFTAGPRSMIKSVLTQAGIPKDMGTAIGQELNRIWARTPN